MSISFLSRLSFSVIVMMAVTLSFFSCSPESLEDDADDFVGTYNASVIENVRWGASSGTLTSTGTFVISKVSANRVKASGYIETYGEVVGNTVYFESEYDSDSNGYLTTVYQQGVLRGNVLTFSTTMTGQLKDNGKLYPFNATCSWTAIKQY